MSWADEEWWDDDPWADDEVWPEDCAGPEYHMWKNGISQSRCPICDGRGWIAVVN